MYDGVFDLFTPDFKKNIGEDTSKELKEQVWTLLLLLTGVHPMAYEFKHLKGSVLWKGDGIALRFNTRTETQCWTRVYPSNNFPVIDFNQV